MIKIKIRNIVNDIATIVLILSLLDYDNLVGLNRDLKDVNINLTNKSNKIYIDSIKVILKANLLKNDNIINLNMFVFTILLIPSLFIYLKWLAIIENLGPIADPSYI